MPNLKLDHFNVNLHILSPIHVGTGQEMDPFSYVIRNQGLFLIDLIKWMESYSDREKLESMMDSDNFANIRSFIAERFNFEDAVLCSIPVDDKNLLNAYERAIKERDPRNQVLISPMTRNEITMEAYIPGSSIKGSIRTAIANRFVGLARVTSNDFKRRDDYNFKIFGRINKDPMRRLKISDITLGKSSTVVVEAKEYPLNPAKTLTPKGHVEAALSLSHTDKPFVYPLRLSLAPFEIHGAKIDQNFIIDSLYRFYVSKYEEEHSKFYQPQGSQAVQQGIIPMNKAVAELRTNETLIRIGHFSHVECVTLDKVRKPRTRRVKGRRLPWGTTRTLANGIYPFGWAKLEFLDLEAIPRPANDWPFLLEQQRAGFKKLVPDAPKFNTGDEQIHPEIGSAIPEKKPQKPVVDIKTPLEKLLDALNLLNRTDIGRISGEIINKMDIMLESDNEKAAIAMAIKEKISAKAFKKLDKKKDRYLSNLIEKTDKGL